MQKYRQLLFSLSIFSSLAACAGNEPASQNAPDIPAAIKITIDPAKTYQTIAHFGASDAWSAQFAGKWPDAKKNGIADLLFSRDTLADGRLKGIGLSMWRFNIGAGTAEQGEQSGIKDEWRRAESFLNNDGTYNWDKQAGQVWFLNAAKTRGVNSFLAFPNSPPVQFTNNKKGYADNGKPNLSANKFDQFAGFMSDVIAGIEKKTGILFDYISPVNEPQWDWSDGGQEGTPFYNNEIAGITRSLSKALLEKNLTTKINIAEAGQIDYLYSESNKQGRGSQIKAFFDKNSAEYVGNLSNVLPVISGHSYFTTSTYKNAVLKRQQVSAALQTVPGMQYWMSEYCVLGDNEGEIKGEGKDLGIGPALYIAKVIHNDLVNANATAWHWWIAISPYDYKDGLVYIDKNKNDGNYESSKMLWALGNYSQFIRPGAIRVDVSGISENEKLLISSCKNADNKLVTVIINSDGAPAEVELTVAGKQASSRKTYVTSASVDLQPAGKIESASIVTVPARSVVTVVDLIR
ncbi:glycoside hydrolase [Dyadobacter aurulentus]|uniref:glycoside hydrolase n=1 Tax=Dyadobacter sp. UC 10 TaxID=2605428 RepID=UPI0011F3FB11|nr:glycoside hydrolase [Dyadobacter sp. UC 10]KAA0992477.1 xylanase [Dyadobacter sp. UC 10]